MSEKKQKAGDRWKEYIKQFAALSGYWDTLPEATELWLAQQIDIFAGLYPPPKPGGAVWVKGVKGFPIKKRVIAKFKHYDDPQRDWIVGWASSSTGEMITFDWNVSSITLDINNERWDMLYWLDESPAEQPAPADPFNPELFQVMQEAEKNKEANWQKVSEAMDRVKGEEMSGPIWIKDSDRKPGHYKVDFIDKHGNEYKGNYSVQTGLYYAYRYAQAISDVIFWKRADESESAEQPADLTQKRADFIREVNNRDLDGRAEQPGREVELIKYIRENYKPSKEVWKDKFGIALLSDEGILNMFNENKKP